MNPRDSSRVVRFVPDRPSASMPQLKMGSGAGFPRRGRHWNRGLGMNEVPGHGHVRKDVCRSTTWVAGKREPLRGRRTSERA